MTTLTVARQELLDVVGSIPENRVIVALDFIKNLRDETTVNAESQAAITELREGKGKRFSTIEALMADLNDGKDD